MASVVVVDPCEITCHGLMAVLSDYGHKVRSIRYDSSTLADHDGYAKSDVEVVVFNAGTLSDPTEILSIGRNLRQAFRYTPLLVLVPSDDLHRLVHRLCWMGVRGVLSAHSSGEQIAASISKVAEGQSDFDNFLLLRDISSFRTSAPALLLTSRELQVIELILSGYTNAEVSEFLGVSEQTVKNYLSRSMAKLGVHNRTQIIRYVEALLVRSALRGEL